MRRGPGPGASGYPGVSLHKTSKLWKAYVHVRLGKKQFKQNCIGYFYTPEAAHEARTAYLEHGVLPKRIGRGGRGQARPRCTACSRTLRHCECPAPEFQVRL